MNLWRECVSVEMLLRDMLYVSYLVPAERVSPHIPRGLELDRVGNKAFVSLVVFRGEMRRASLLPCPRLRWDQMNVRTYLIDPATGAPAVYFLNCGISSPLITRLYKLTSGMPVEHIPLSIETSSDGAGAVTSYGVTGTWHGDVLIQARETAPAFDVMPPFASAADAIAHLINPLVGLYGSPRRLWRLEVAHAPLVPRTGKAREVAVPYLSSLGLVDAAEAAEPHNVLYVDHTPFVIYLPPSIL